MYITLTVKLSVNNEQATAIAVRRPHSHVTLLGNATRRERRTRRIRRNVGERHQTSLKLPYPVLRRDLIDVPFSELLSMILGAGAGVQDKAAEAPSCCPPFGSFLPEATPSLIGNRLVQLHLPSGQEAR